MVFNQLEEAIISSKGKTLKCVEDVKYLGSWIESSKKDLEVRIGLAWSGMNKMSAIWESTLPNDLKIQFFRAAVESILIYGAECWTLTKAMENRSNGTYTKLLKGERHFLETASYKQCIVWRNTTVNGNHQATQTEIYLTLLEKKRRSGTSVVIMGINTWKKRKTLSIVCTATA